MRKSIILIILFIIVEIRCVSQVSIVPSVVFIDAQSRSGMITILNQQSKPKEVEIFLKFGYMGFDSLGKNTLIYPESETEKKYSILPYTSVYPKKFTLQPKQEQAVKFLIKNTGSLPDGTYWLRVITSSQDVAKQIDSTNLKDSVRIGIAFRINFVTALFFQKGNLNTSVEVSSLETNIDTTNLNVLFSFKRGGNSPFLGTAKVRIYDSKDDEVVSYSERIPIYFDSKKGFSFDKNKFNTGKYKAEITLSDEQPDIPDENKVKFKELTRVFDFKLEQGQFTNSIK
jgi:hypothetical protein